MGPLLTGILLAIAFGIAGRGGAVVPESVVPGAVLPGVVAPAAVLPGVVPPGVVLSGTVVRAAPNGRAPTALSYSRTASAPLDPDARREAVRAALEALGLAAEMEGVVDSDGHPVCGNALAALLRERWEEIPADIRAVLGTSAPGGARGPDVSSAASDTCSAFRDTPHFRIWYRICGREAPYGWPSTAYVDSVAFFLEEGYRVYHETLGLPLPLQGFGAPEGKVSCTIEDTGGYGAGFAQCFPEEEPCPYSGSCRIRICHTFGTDDYSDLLRDTAVHEYFHVVQGRLSDAESDWFHESTAVWAEHAVRPTRLQYSWRMPGWFKTPYVPLWGLGHSLRSYGSVHFWIFLEEITDLTFVPSMWQRCCAQRWREALDSELQARGLSFDEALARFSLWNNATGTFDDGAHYPQGGGYPEITCQAEHRILPVASAGCDSTLRAWDSGSDYIRFFGPGATDTLRIRLFPGDRSRTDDPAGDELPARLISVARTTPGLPQEEWTAAPGADGSVEFAVPGWGKAQAVTLIVTALDRLTREQGFAYSAREEGPPLPGELSSLTALPNPSSGEVRLRLRAAGSLPAAEVEVFDPRGRLRLRLPATGARPGVREITWDPWAPGSTVGPGVWFIRAHAGGESAVARVTVLPRE